MNSAAALAAAPPGGGLAGVGEATGEGPAARAAGGVRLGLATPGLTVPGGRENPGRAPAPP